MKKSDNIILNLLVFIFALLGNTGIAVGHTALTDNPVVAVSVTGCVAEITTTLTDPNSSPNAYYLGEPSLGFFYRLDKADGTQSYFWDTIIYATNTSIVKKIELPAGDYTVVCYQTRKGGPIRTSHLASFNVPGSSTCTAQFPKVNQTSSPILLNTSWNVFTDAAMANPAEDHRSTPSGSNTPTQPWLFVTVSVDRAFFSNNSPVLFNFDNSLFAYSDAIISNEKSNSTSSTWKGVSSIVNKNNGTLEISYSNTGTGEINVYLILKNIAEIRQDSVTFTATAGGVSSTIKPGVHGKPHDPNYLEVDKKILCPCECDEYLVYRVNFQNKGTAPATKVEVILQDPAKLLYPKTIEVLDNGKGKKGTILKNAPVVHNKNNKPKYFRIEPISLPGTGQDYPYWQTEDFFRFKIKKKNCLPEGTIIEPYVDIIFYGNSVKLSAIQTNLEKTEIKNVEGCNTGVGNTACENCRCKKKPCWLFSIFQSKNKK